MTDGKKMPGHIIIIGGNLQLPTATNRSLRFECFETSQTTYSTTYIKYMNYTDNIVVNTSKQGMQGGKQ